MKNVNNEICGLMNLRRWVDFHGEELIRGASLVFVGAT